MSSYEVPEPILNAPFAEPTRYWYIREGEEPELRTGRRPAVVFPPQDQREAWNLSDGTLGLSKEYPGALSLVLVNLTRERVKAWRGQGYPGVTSTTLDLLRYWYREGREDHKRQFFAQLEAAETVIFLNEARGDFLQGIQVPREEPSDDRKAQGYAGFQRYACKMATGSGKTTVMGMLAAWSMLNKVHDRGNAKFSDVVLVVCPNVTIRDRLRELDPKNGEASIFRTRDLVPPHLMPRLRDGKLLVTNWHVFEPQSLQQGGTSAKVIRAGVPIRMRETITIGSKTTTARGTRYLTEDDFKRQLGAGMLRVLPNGEERDKDGNLKRVHVESYRYVESDTALINRVLGREVGGKQNILVMNDEAHHAYRINRDEPDEQEELDIYGDEEEAEEFFKEATVWIDGLDRVHKLRGINFCVDLSATPYFLGRVGQETGRPFPWVVSDFGLIDAIESGLVKIPQLAVRDTTNREIPGYFNVWQWILPQLTAAERGGRKADPKPEAILKYAHTPIAMLGALWEKECEDWTSAGDDSRKPVFILVCKNTKTAKVAFEWLAENKCPPGIPPSKIESFRNHDDEINTIRVDSKVVHETDTGEAKGDESRWMRFTLDTVGKREWPADRQGRPICPEGFEELARKLGRPLHPPGRDVRCIVSVGMLTEGWDCSTVTHIVGLRPFMSQLLCEQVVGRGLRRASYEVGEDGKFTEEVAKVFGVPFEVIPFKATKQGAPAKPVKRWHVHAIPAKAEFEIQFPRVEGYTQAIRNRVSVDWSSVPPLVLDPGKIPPEVEVKGLSMTNEGRLSLHGPGRIDDVTLREFRAKRRLQELTFDLAGSLTRQYVAHGRCAVPVHVLFPQVARIVQQYVFAKVQVYAPADRKDLFLAPYYGWLVERLLEAIRPDTANGEAPEVPRYECNRGPGSTADVDFTTTREPYPVRKCHLNWVVLHSGLEQKTAFAIDRHPQVAAWVKNAGLGFAITYFHNGQMHDYIPDFIIRLAGEVRRHLILETKGYDPLEKVKAAAAQRWVAAVNADGTYGQWLYRVSKAVEDVEQIIAEAIRRI